VSARAAGSTNSTSTSTTNSTSNALPRSDTYVSAQKMLNQPTHNIIAYRLTRYDPVWFILMQLNTIQPNTILSNHNPFNTIQLNTTQSRQIQTNSIQTKPRKEPEPYKAIT